MTIWSQARAALATLAGEVLCSKDDFKSLDDLSVDFYAKARTHWNSDTALIARNLALDVERLFQKFITKFIVCRVELQHGLSLIHI